MFVRFTKDACFTSLQWKAVDAPQLAYLIAAISFQDVQWFSYEYRDTFESEIIDSNTDEWLPSSIRELSSNLPASAVSKEDLLELQPKLCVCCRHNFLRTEHLETSPHWAGWRFDNCNDPMETQVFQTFEIALTSDIPYLERGVARDFDKVKTLFPINSEDDADHFWHFYTGYEICDCDAQKFIYIAQEVFYVHCRIFETSEEQWNALNQSEDGAWAEPFYEDMYFDKLSEIAVNKWESYEQADPYDHSDSYLIYLACGECGVPEGIQGASFEKEDIIRLIVSAIDELKSLNADIATSHWTSFDKALSKSCKLEDDLSYTEEIVRILESQGIDYPQLLPQFAAILN